MGKKRWHVCPLPHLWASNHKADCLWRLIPIARSGACLLKAVGLSLIFWWLTVSEVWWSWCFEGSSIVKFSVLQKLGLCGKTQWEAVSLGTPGAVWRWCAMGRMAHWLLLKRPNFWWGGCLLGELESSLRSNYFIWFYFFLEHQDFVFCLTRVADCSWYLISAWVSAVVSGLLWQRAAFCCSFCFLCSLWLLLFLRLRKTTLRITVIDDVNYAGFNKITGSSCPSQIP